MRFALATLLLADAVVAAPVPKDLKKPDDTAAIVGTWKPILFNGKAQGATAWFQFDADGKMKTWHSAPIGNPLSWTYSLDPASTPKRTKLTNNSAPGGETTTFDCLYELAGDTLKIAFITDKTKDVPEKLEPHPAIQLYEMTRSKGEK